MLRQPLLEYRTTVPLLLRPDSPGVRTRLTVSGLLIVRSVAALSSEATHGSRTVTPAAFMIASHRARARTWCWVTRARKHMKRAIGAVTPVRGHCGAFTVFARSCVHTCFSNDITHLDP